MATTDGGVLATEKETYPAVQENDRETKAPISTTEGASGVRKVDEPIKEPIPPKNDKAGKKASIDNGTKEGEKPPRPSLGAIVRLL
eukprot:Em0001g2335a